MDQVDVKSGTGDPFSKIIELLGISSPLHQGQLRAVVGFPYTWSDIHLPWVDFQPLLRNPTSGW